MAPVRFGSPPRQACGLPPTMQRYAYASPHGSVPRAAHDCQAMRNDDDSTAALPTGDRFEQAEQEFRSATRAEAEASEREAAQLSMRSRSLADVAFDAMSRGDTLAVTAGGKTFTGRVDYAAGDLMTLETSLGRIDVNLAGPVAIQVVERARSGGRARTAGPGSFRGRLLEHEGAREVEVWAAVLAGPLRGKVRVAARDHVVFEDREGREWVLPLAAVGYVARLAG